MAIVCCALWLVAGAGCATQQQQQPRATKPWYQLGSWKKAQPEADQQVKVTDIRDMSRAGATAGAQPGAPGAQPGMGQPGVGQPGQPAMGQYQGLATQPGYGSAGMASASSGQQY